MEPANPIDKTRLEHLSQVIAKGPVLILTHDNPDPDALASGVGLAYLIKQYLGIPSDLIYHGLVARAENRAVLNMLTPDWKQAGELPDMDRYSAIALVDTQPGNGNNQFPGERVPDIVIDHHYPNREALRLVPFVDVRSELGSTSSLVYQYLEAAGVIPDGNLATAMFYGLQTDTRGLARGATRADELIYMELLTLIDRAKLISVEQAGLTRDYFRAITSGLQATRVYRHSVIVNLESMHRPDLAAEMCDILIRLESARAALCYGIYQGQLNLSLRTEPSGQDAGLLLLKVIDSLGSAGGHGTMAGGQILLRGKDLNELITEIETRFLKVMGESGMGKPLLA